MVLRALERVKDFCGTNKKYKDLLGVCEYTAAHMKQKYAQAGDSAMSLAFVPLYMALMRHPKTAVISLEILRKLVEHSYITGDMRWEAPKYDDVATKDAKWKETVQIPAPLKRSRGGGAHPPGEERLVDHVVSAICDVSGSWENGDVVQLFVIQALLAAVSTTSCHIYGSTLISAVRITYNICLATCNSENGVVKETHRAAGGALKHIILLIYQRMEAANAGTAEKPSKPPPALEDTRRSVTPVSPAAGEKGEAVATPEAAEADAQGAAEAAPEEDAELVNREATEATEMDDEPAEEADATVDDASSPLSAEDDPPAVAATISSSAMADDNMSVAGSVREAPEGAFRNYQERDAYTLLEKLCMRCKDTCQETTPLEQRTSKLLSLQLIKYILEQFGAALRGSPVFASLVKKNLCLSLLNNCVSPVLPIFKECCKVFIKLIEHFWDDLKREIELFFTNVFFIILGSPNASDQQKMVVVTVISTLANMPEVIVNMFLNYDCDVNSVNVFETMTDNLSKVVADRKAAIGGQEISKQDQKMRLHALLALVMILRSITQWMGKFDDASEAAASPMIDASGTPARDRDVQDDCSNLDTSNDADVTKDLSQADVTGEGDDGTEVRQESGDDIEEARKRKRQLADLYELFNKSPKKGVEMCFKMGIVDRGDALGVATWMKETRPLSKDAIGAYLGILHEFNRKVLSEFIDGFDFRGQEIDEAVRKLMSSFRIHGEAEAIDVTMEKFAATFTKHNPDMFANQDTAFVLAFSIIMLHTDAHSVSIKKEDKMTKEQFFTNNRKIDNGKDLPKPLLSAIYDRVTSVPFTLEGDKASQVAGARNKKGLFDVLTRESAKKRTRQRQNQYCEDAEAIVMRTKALLCGETGETAIFRFASKLRHVRPMFEAAWARMLVAFSVLLEECEETEIIDLCVEGFSKCIRISCAFYLDTERDAFVSALSKLTFLNNHREIEEKNVKSIKALIEIAQTEGHTLRSSWYEVLSCFSQLEMLQLLGAGAKPDFAFAAGSPSSKKGGPAGKPAPGQGADFRVYEEKNSVIIAEHINEVAVSRIYSNTPALSEEAIVDFVKHLCRVSQAEIENTHPPRRFSLQKLIETLDSNRGRLPSRAWDQMWRHTAEHLIRVGTNKSAAVSMIGIDSLRQLAAKFLEKPEPPDYMFQRMFLSPFEKILTRSCNSVNRELIVRCIAQIVESRGQSGQIQSGWKCIFGVLTSAAQDKNEHVVTLAFETLRHIIEAPVQLPPGSAYADMVTSLIAFSTQTLDGGTAVEAIQHLIACSKILGEMNVADAQGNERRPSSAPSVEEHGSATPANNGSLDSLEGEVGEDGEKMLPIFTGLGSSARQHPQRDCRLAAVNGLFGVLKNYAQRMSLKMWKIVLSGSVFPIFEDAICTICTDLPATVAASTTAPSTPPTGPATPPAAASPPPSEVENIVRGNIDVVELGLTLLVDLFFEYFKALKPLLGDVLNVILSCIKRPTPKRVANFGVTLLVELVVNHSPATWADLAHKYHIPKGENSARRIARDERQDERFTATEWQTLTQKLSRMFAAKLNAAGFVDPAREGDEGGAAAAAPVAGQLQHVAPVYLHLHALLNFLQTLERLVVCLAPQWPEETLVDMLACFTNVHSHAFPKAQAEVAALAKDCQERAMYLHVRSLIALHPPYRGPERASAMEESPHAAVVSDLLYPLMVSFFRRPRAAPQHLLVFLVDSLVALEDDEFAVQLSTFYAPLLDLVMSTSTHVREAVRRFFAKAGRVKMGIAAVED